MGTIVNSNFMSADNLLNVATRCAFIALVGIGATFVIVRAASTCRIGLMTAFVAGVMIMTMNAGSGVPGIAAPRLADVPRRRGGARLSLRVLPTD